MNERIKELSAWAKNLTTDEAIHLSRIHNRTLSLDELGEIYDQKFAELIVQECLNQCYNRGMDDELYAGQLKAATYIEEYFGVKE